MSIANELITRGWCQLKWNAPDGSVCLHGAVIKAYPPSSGAVYNRAMAAVERVLAAAGYPTVLGFNDNRSRTFDEVLRVAKEADAILDQ